MRRTTVLIAAMAAMVVVYAGAALAEEPTDTLDAHYSLDGTEPSYSGFDQRYKQAQTFTVENTGDLTRAEVTVNRSSSTNSDLKMDIVSVDASGLPTDNVLASASLPASEIVTYGGGAMETFTFNEPAVVRAGKQYAFVMDGNDATYFFALAQDSFSGSPGYPGGQGYWLNHDFTVLGNIRDHLFAIYVAPRDVPDVTSPVLSLPDDITEEAEGPNGATVSWQAPTATDDVDGSVTVNCDKTPGDTFPIGTTTVNCSATDAAGNTTSDSFDVTVQDTTAPTLNLPADITEESTGPDGKVVNYSASATDLVDGSVNATCSPASGATFGVKTTTVDCSATDAAGNTASGSFDITVQDTTAPKVKRVVPVENATDIAPATNVSAFFSEAMRAGSINTNTIKLFETGNNTAVEAQVGYDAERKRVTLNPEANLKRGTRYKAVVTAGARDLVSNRLDQDQDASNGLQQKAWFFTVRN